jgi:6-phosphogluconolactonase (cycloisomerase 2 family)
MRNHLAKSEKGRRQGAGDRVVVFLFLVAFAFIACSHSYRITVEPADAILKVDDQPAVAGKEYSTREASVTVSAAREGHEDFRKTFPLGSVLVQDQLTIQLEKKKFPVEIKLTSGKAQYRIDDALTGAAPFKGELAFGEHTVVFTSPGASDLTAVVDVRKAGAFVFRLQTEALPIKALGIYPCGSQPKQVIFSPDSRFLYIPLLNDVGFQIFDMEKKEMLSKVSVGPKPKLKGFPEGLFLEKYKTFLITQMSTNTVFEYTYADDGTVVFKRMFPSLGGYPKFLAYAPSLDLLAVSNWLTNDVTVFDYQTARAVKKIPNLATPRGLAFTPDDKFLYVTSYDGGNVFKFGTADWKETVRFFKAKASMRHIVLDPGRNRCFVSDMANYLIFELDMTSLALIHTYKASYCPNTISLNADGRLLFVSCRGPNNPVDYTLRSPKDSMVMIFDTEKKALIGTIQGGNQPTGLDLSSDDRFLVFTNFQDANFEIYDVSELCRVKK